MRILLIVTSFLEGATGLALIAKPLSLVSVLLGRPLSDPIGILMTRIAGAALVSIAIACWFSRKNKDVNGLIYAL
jgi:riboflavin transporter FmnP